MNNQLLLVAVTIVISYSCSNKRIAKVTSDQEVRAPGYVKEADLGDVIKVLSDVVFKYDTVPGIGHETGCTRRDPSDVIKVGDTWYVWYTKVYGRSPGYWGSIWYATSKDEGYTWQEIGEALGMGAEGSFDSQATFTPNILYAEGKYYLFYTGVKPTPGRTDGVFENNSTNDITAIGVAESALPDGPFSRLHGGEPVLQKSNEKNDFDSYRIDDAVLLVRDGKYWLFFKGIACLASLSSTFEYAHDGLDFDTANLNIKIPEKERPKAPGAFRPDLMVTEAENTGLTWGISMVHNGDESYLIRWKALKIK